MNSIDYDKIRINQIFFESKHFDGTFQEGKKLAEIKNKLLSTTNPKYNKKGKE